MSPYLRLKTVSGGKVQSLLTFRGFIPPVCASLGKSSLEDELWNGSHSRLWNFPCHQISHCNNNKGVNSKRISESQLYNLLNLPQSGLKLGVFIKIGKIHLHVNSSEFLRLCFGFFLNTMWSFWVNIVMGNALSVLKFLSCILLLIFASIGIVFSHAFRKSIIIKQNYPIQ